MKSATVLGVAASALALAVTGAAHAGSKLTDVDYLKANRCRGLAAGLAQGDTSSLDALIKAEGASRSETIYVQGQKEADRGRRDASHLDGRERLTAELNGPCVAFLSGGKATASAR